MTPEIILGPPGCGKTTALLQIVEETLGRGVEPERIGLLTFTRRAAEEARQRAAEKFALDVRRFTNFRTLHSLCYRQLGISRGDILEGQMLQEFGEWAGIDVRSRGSMDEGWSGVAPGHRILHLENLSRVSGRSLREVFDMFDHDLLWTDVKRVAEDLLAFKRAKGVIDYTDMLSMYVAEARSMLSLDTLLIDEAQDLSLLQWQVVAKVSQGVGRLVVAGDDDQAIYTWAGAALDHFIGLEGQVRVLDQSWRVPVLVQELANEIADQMERRREKLWHSRPDRGEVDRLVSPEEVDFETGDDILVLARNHIWLERDVVPVLRREGIYYSLRGKPSFNKDLLEEVMGWERLRRGERVGCDLVRRVLYHVPREERGSPLLDGEDVSMDELKRQGLGVDGIWHEALSRMPAEDVSYMLAARQRGEKFTEEPRVKLSTIHGSKGGQADHVVLLTDMSGRTFQEYQKLPDDERRVWYVGVTRTKEKLTIVTRPSSPNNFFL